MTLSISWNQVPKPPSFELGSRRMVIWGGNCPISYKNETNKTKIKEYTLCFADVSKKINSDIIFQVMKYEPK